MTTGDSFRASNFVRWLVALLRNDETIVAFLPPYDSNHDTIAPRLITQGDGYHPATSGIAITTEPASTVLSRGVYRLDVDFRVSLRNDPTALSSTTNWAHMVNECLFAISRAITHDGQSAKVWGVAPSLHGIGIKRAVVVTTEQARVRDPETSTFDGMVRVRFDVRFTFDAEIETPASSPPPPPPPPPPPSPNTPAELVSVGFKPGSSHTVVVFTFSKAIDIAASIYIDFAFDQFIVRTGLTDELAGTGTAYTPTSLAYGGAIAANTIEATFSLPGLLPIYLAAQYVGFPIAIVDEDGLVINSSERLPLTV